MCTKFERPEACRWCRGCLGVQSYPALPHCIILYIAYRCFTVHVLCSCLQWSSFGGIWGNSSLWSLMHWRWGSDHTMSKQLSSSSWPLCPWLWCGHLLLNAHWARYFDTDPKQTNKQTNTVHCPAPLAKWESATESTVAIHIYSYWSLTSSTFRCHLALHQIYRWVSSCFVRSGQLKCEYKCHGCGKPSRSWSVTIDKAPKAGFSNLHREACFSESLFSFADSSSDIKATVAYVVREMCIMVPSTNTAHTTRQTHMQLLDSCLSLQGRISSRNNYSECCVRVVWTRNLLRIKQTQSGRHKLCVSSHYRATRSVCMCQPFLSFSHFPDIL